MGNHLSLRPEPGADNAVERRLALYLVLLREEFTSTAALSLPARWALTPPFQPYRKNSGGIFSVALVFPRLIVRGIPLFKGTPCSMQSGLSSAGKRTVTLQYTGHPPGRDCPRTTHPCSIIYNLLLKYASCFSP